MIMPTRKEAAGPRLHEPAHATARVDSTFSIVDAPRLPEGFSAWRLWQYEGDASVPGVEKTADLSRAHPERGLDGLRLSTRSPGR